MKYLETIGQVAGFVSVLFALLSYQMRTHRQVVLVHTFEVLAIAISYGLLGAWPGMMLNLIAVIRNLVFYFENTFRGKGWPWVMAGVMAVAGLLSWNGPWSILVIIGLIINTVFMATPNPQHLRMSILVTSPMVLLYDVIVFSLGGILLESVSIISAIIGLLRYRNRNSKEK